MALLTSDSPGLIAAFGSPQWGIFNQGGGQLLVVDAVADVDYSRDYRISDYPQEEGAFQTYNKVQVPFLAKIGFYIAQSRVQFLNAIETAMKSRDFVTVVTPEISYPSANLTHYDYHREARSGVTLIKVNVWCEEVRIISGSSSSNPQSTNGKEPSQSGNIQPVETTQNPPAASDGTASPPTVGGGFTPDPNRTTLTFTDPSIPALDPTPTIPPGIPNSTGGGAGAADTSLQDAINGSAVAGGI